MLVPPRLGVSQESFLPGKRITTSISIALCLDVLDGPGQRAFSLLKGRVFVPIFISTCLSGEAKHRAGEWGQWPRLAELLRVTVLANPAELNFLSSVTLLPTPCSNTELGPGSVL